MGGGPVRAEGRGERRSPRGQGGGGGGAGAGMPGEAGRCYAAGMAPIRMEDAQHVEVGALLDDLAVGKAVERHALRADGLHRPLEVEECLHVRGG